MGVFSMPRPLEQPHEQKHIRENAKPEILRKALAIWVALSWSPAVSSHVSGLLAQLGVALCAYSSVWATAGMIGSWLQPRSFEWYTMLAAGLVAFLVRDATVLAKGDYLPTANATNTTAHGVWLSIAWASVLSLVAMAWLAFGGYARDTPGASGESEGLVNDFMSAVELDVTGLFVGYALVSTVYYMLLGSTWADLVEVGSDPRMKIFGVCYVLILVAMLAKLRILKAIGVASGGSAFKLVLSSCAFAGGFLLDSWLRYRITGGGEELSLMSYAYPLLMLSVACVVVARKKFYAHAAGDATGCFDSCKRAFGSCLSCCVGPSAMDLCSTCVLGSWQLALALSFQGLSEKLLDDAFAAHSYLRFLFAAALTLAFTLVCVLLPPEPMETEDEKQPLHAYSQA